MVNRVLQPRPVVDDALRVTGQLIRTGRGDRGWSAGELAGRAGVSERTVLAAESGAPGTAFATVLELLVLTGSAPFGIEDPIEMARLRRRGEERLALLPSRVRRAAAVVDDDF